MELTFQYVCVGEEINKILVQSDKGDDISKTGWCDME